MSKPELIYFPQSPFSWRAKWALDAAGVDYSITPYALSPFYVFELPLRWRLGRLTGKITAPIMLLPNSTTSSAGNRVMMDSTEIAHWADSHSSSQPGALFPEGRAADVDKWIKAADQMSSLFRRELVAAALAEPAVIDGMLPPGLTGVSAIMARYMMRNVLRGFEAKYKQQDAAAQLDQVMEDLAALRNAVFAHPNKLLLLPNNNQLTYAEITMATTIMKAADIDAKSIEGLAAAVAAKAGPDRFAELTPSVQQILNEYGDLVQWAQDITEQRWPAGPGMSKQSRS